MKEKMAALKQRDAPRPGAPHPPPKWQPDSAMPLNREQKLLSSLAEQFRGGVADGRALASTGMFKGNTNIHPAQDGAACPHGTGRCLVSSKELSMLKTITTVKPGQLESGHALARFRLGGCSSCRGGPSSYS
jgi:hypothetical protein